MRFNVSIIPNSKIEKIEALDENSFRVKVRAKPIEGEANRALIRLLSDYFHAPKSSIRIIQGFNSKFKVIEII
ncbi:MAG: DUF167 domain-containing protein [Candidatus Pacebacteria bacterium]|nr:DUF167 domain-containing protein [Candidatus Paceibacterota bacterium]